MEPINVEDSIMDRIPNEIVSKILSYLPASFMKSARLVCSKWYEASKHVSIMKHQKFVFFKYKIPELNIQLNTLRNGYYNYYNLDITGCVDDSTYFTLDEEFESFIESEGLRIRSLYFRDLCFKSTTIEKIMINCTNLIELSFVHCDYKSSIDTIPIENGVQIERNMLKTLKFEFAGWNIIPSDSLFKVFINVYPHIEKLVFTGDLVRHSDKKITYSSICRTISEKCKNLITLNLATNRSFPKDTVQSLMDVDLEILASTSSCFKLKELKISRHRAISWNGLKTVLSQQMNIISLDISYCQPFNFQCIQYLLDQNNFNLEHLGIRTREMIHIPSLLQKSRLKSLHIQIPKPMKNDTEIINSHLKKLFVKSYEFGFFYFPQAVLKSFPNLTYLHLSCTYANSSVGSYIFTNMVHLETIILKSFLQLTNSAFENSTGKLKNLKYLNLYGCNRITEEGLKNFYYPKLKYLNLDQCFQINESGFVHLAKTSPLMEHLVVSRIISCNSLLRESVLAKLKHLRRLEVHDNCTYRPDEGEIRSYTYCLKQRCPLLHFVQYQFGSNITYFTYNPTNKKFNEVFER